MPEEKTASRGSRPDGPIFIQGIMHRSGTNFLYGLLELHPHCQCGPIREDFLVANSDILRRYHEALENDWNKIWQLEERLGTPDALYRSIGDGLISFIDLQKGVKCLRSGKEEKWVKVPQEGMENKRVVTKTPSVENLDMFFRLFPGAQLIILVRDGRAVVESAVKSFGWSYAVTMKRWADAARTIEEFRERNQKFKDRFIVVRYEDLHLNLESEMKRILRFLGLNVKRYDIRAARSLPVSGSSEIMRQGDGKLKWDHVEKTPDFKPEKRFASWGRMRHRRFNWIAGEYNKALGYELKHVEGSGALWALWNRAADVPMKASVGIRGGGRRLLRMTGLRVRR